MSRRGAALFAAMCVVWGIPYLMIRVAVRELAPVTLVFGRTAVAALILLPLAAYRRDLRVPRSRWASLLAYTAIEVAIPWVLLARAETKLSSSLTGLLIAAVPLVGVVLVLATGARERPSRRRWLGLVIGLVGVVALLGFDVGHVDATAVVEVAIVAVCYATGPIILARRLGDVPALAVVSLSLALTAIVYAPLAALHRPGSTPSGDVLLSVLGLAVICTAVAFVIFLALIAELGPVRPMVFTYVNPAVAAVLGVLVLGEHLTAGMLIGFALVLAGSILATRGGEPVPEPAAVTASSEAAA